jgi:hypothetical protein
MLLLLKTGILSKLYAIPVSSLSCQIIKASISQEASAENAFWSKIDSFELSATKVAVSEDRSATLVAECEHRQDHLAGKGFTK